MSGLRLALIAIGWLIWVPGAGVLAEQPAASGLVERESVDFESARRLRGYFERMSTPQPFLVRAGDDWVGHRQQLRRFVLACAGLDPLPERVPLDVRLSEPLDHPVFGPPRLVSAVARRLRDRFAVHAQGSG